MLQIISKLTSMQIKKKLLVHAKLNTAFVSMLCAWKLQSFILVKSLFFSVNVFLKRRI